MYTKQEIKRQSNCSDSPLDKLVENGTNFTQAHIPGATCGGVCLPSRAMLHTGKTLFHLQKNGSYIPEEHTLMGEVLQKEGYETYGVGKWHNGTQSYARSFTDGDEIMFGGMADHWNVPICDFDPDGNYEEALSYIIDDPFTNNEVRERYCEDVHPGKHSSELFCETSAEWLRNYDQENPFFMYISFMAPHDPRSMPEEFLNMYDPDDIELPENFREKPPFEFLDIDQRRDESLATYPRQPEEIKKHIAEYYAMITHLDHEMGKVIETLKETGEYENTIIIFAGDNGLAVGQHGLVGKQNLYDHSIRVPLVFSGPGIPAGEERDSYVYLLDIFPTICDFIGSEIPDSVEGISMFEVIQNENQSIRDTLYLAYEDLIRGVKSDGYKLLKYRKNGRYNELFNLNNDPYEIDNLYHEPQYEDKIKELENKLLKKKKEWDDEKHMRGESYWNE